SATMLLVPGTFLDAMWRINPQAHSGFLQMGPWAVVLMCSVCFACATAALGLWRCRIWGWWTALVILSMNLAGDTIHFIAAHDGRTLLGLPIGGLMIAYLVKRRDIFKG